MAQTTPLGQLIIPTRSMQIPQEFRELDLYAVLQVDRSADADALKRAYRRRALQTHPDKCPEKDEEFKQVAFAWTILSDEGRRERYNKNDVVSEAFDDLQEAFDQFSSVEITPEMIEEDKKLYRESGEEHADIIKFYKKFNGDFNRILDSVLHTTEDDEDRIVQILQQALESGEIEPQRKFTKTTSATAKKTRRTKAAKESKKAARARKQLGLDRELDSMSGLAAVIKKRQASKMDSFMSSLEKKYAA